MKKMLIGMAVLAIALAATIGMTTAQDAKPKYTIKAVMKEAHKDGLMKKVAEGKGTADEKKKLVELYEALAKNDPPKGDKADWKKKTETLVKLAKEAADGKGKGEDLTKAANCADCHKAHKGA